MVRVMRQTSCAWLVVGLASLPFGTACGNEEKVRVSAMETRLGAMEVRLANAETQAASAASAAASVAAAASAAGLVGPCATAKQKSRSAWSSIVSAARKESDEAKAEKCRRVQDWGGDRPCEMSRIGVENLPAFQVLEGRFRAWSALVVAARQASDATASSALRIKETADAVKAPPDGKLADAFAAAVVTSKAAYEACKESDP